MLYRNAGQCNFANAIGVNEISDACHWLSLNKMQSISITSNHDIPNLTWVSIQLRGLDNNIYLSVILRVLCLTALCEKLSKLSMGGTAIYRVTIWSLEHTASLFESGHFKSLPSIIWKLKGDRLFRMFGKIDSFLYDWDEMNKIELVHHLSLFWNNTELCKIQCHGACHGFS